MRALLKAMVCLGALAVALPAQAASDFSSALVSVTDLGDGRYDFIQTGWSAGGTVTGTFTGFDTDNNGQLSSFLNEITDFTMAFSGNGVTRAYTLDYDSFYGLVYNLDGGPLGDAGDDFGGVDGVFGGPDENGILGYSLEGFAAYGDTAFYIAGPGMLEACGSALLCALISATDDLQDLPGGGGSGSGSSGGGGGGGSEPLAPVPEPSSWTLLIAGFGLTGSAMRRRRAYRIA